MIHECLSGRNIFPTTSVGSIPFELFPRYTTRGAYRYCTARWKQSEIHPHKLFHITWQSWEFESREEKCNWWRMSMIWYYSRVQTVLKAYLRLSVVEVKNRETSRVVSFMSWFTIETKVKSREKTRDSWYVMRRAHTEWWLRSNHSVVGWIRPGLGVHSQYWWSVSEVYPFFFCLSLQNLLFSLLFF